MDLSNAGGVAGVVSLIIVIADRIFQTVNHKRIRSNCCGREGQSSLDVENTTPPLTGISSSSSDIPKA